MNDGYYSGFMKPDSKLEYIRFGPGTLVQKLGNWRMEGIWCYDVEYLFFGQKEYNDGEI
jgi:hypothetical protein